MLQLFWSSYIAPIYFRDKPVILSVENIKLDNQQDDLPWYLPGYVM